MVGKTAASVVLVSVGIMALIAILGTDGTAAAARRLSTSIIGTQEPSARRLDEINTVGRFVIQEANDWADAGPVLDEKLNAHLRIFNELQPHIRRFACSASPSACRLSMTQLWCSEHKDQFIKDHLHCSTIVEGQEPPQDDDFDFDENADVEALKQQEHDALRDVMDAAGKMEAHKNNVDTGVVEHLELFNALKRLGCGGAENPPCKYTVKDVWCSDFNKKTNPNVATLVKCDGSGAKGSGHSVSSTR